MKMLPKFASRPRQFRRFILTTTILPAALASSAFGLTIWTGPVALNTGAAPDDIHVTANATVTLANTGAGPSITETSISFEPAIATETLTVDGPSLTLRALATVLAIANGKTITINGSADFAPGSLSTGVGVTTGISLIKDGGAGTLLLDDPINNMVAGTILKVLNGTLSIVGAGGTANPVSSLTAPIEIGSTGVQTPVLRIGSSAGDTTFNNSFNALNTGTIDHLTATNDTLGSATSTSGIGTGKTLTVNVAPGGSLVMNGTIARVNNVNAAGGPLKKMGTGTTLTLSGTVFVANLNIAEGNVDVPGRLRTSTTPTFGPNTTLTLRNQSTTAFNVLPATVIVPSTATLEGVPGAFSVSATVQSTLSLTGGTLNLGIGLTAPVPGLAANLYTTGWAAAQTAFGGPQFPANTYANYTSYFAGIGAGTVTTTSAGGVTELSFDPGFGNTAMFQILAPTYTRTDDIVARFKGKIIITAPGAYTFATDADDGSMLYIDGATVVSNNLSQAHVRRTGTVALAPGLHDIDIGYYEGGGLNGIIVDYSGPDTGGVQTVMPNSVLLPLGSAPTAFLNPVTVSQNSIINTGNGASVASLSLSVTKTVNVNGYQFDMGPLTLTGGAGIYTLNAATQYAEVCARSVTDGGAAVALVNNGPGMLILESLASPQLQNAGASVTSGALGIVLGGAGGSPTGNATVNVNGGSLMLSSKGGDQSYTPAGLSFTLGGSISAGKICSGIAGTTGTPIRTTLTSALTVNNAATLTLTSRDNYILNVGALSGGGSVSVLAGTVETSGAINLTGTGQLTVANSKMSTLAGASAGAISVTDATLTNTGTLTSANTLSVTRSTLSSTGNISATGPVTVTDSTVSGTGTLASGSTMGVLRSTVTRSGPISSTGAMTATDSTVNANGGGSAASITVTNGKFVNTGALSTGPGGIALNGTGTIPVTLELHGGSIAGGPIAAQGAVIHVTSGLTTATTSANFTGSNPTGLRGRFLGTGGEFVPPLYPGNTAAGILAIETLPAVEAILTSALSFGGQGGADGVISTFFGGVNTAQRFSMGFFGNFTAPATGLYSAQTGIVDDTAGIWVDLDQDGVFETAGAAGNELIAAGTCCGNGPVGTATLVQGQTYKVGIAVEDTGGGSSLEGRAAVPGGPIGVINPGDPAQAGLWSYGLPNQVVVDPGAELDIQAINGDVNVLVNGHLEFDGAGSSTIDSLVIGPGGIVEVGSGPPSPAGLEGAALAVPEPGSLGLALLGALGLLGRRRVRRD